MIMHAMCVRGNDDGDDKIAPLVNDVLCSAQRSVLSREKGGEESIYAYVSSSWTKDDTPQHLDLPRGG